MPGKRRPLADRFWGRVNKDGSIPEHRPELGQCWEWIGGRFKNGYGCVGGGLYAHQVGYELQNGPIPDGLWVLHKCDNPLCVRGGPDGHLFVGTHQQNMADMIAKGRSYAQRNPKAAGMIMLNTLRLHPELRATGERHHAARLTKQQVQQIRKQYADGEVTQVELAAQYGVSQGTISSIVLNKIWRSSDHVVIPSEEGG